jgi:hypothetical protein
MTRVNVVVEGQAEETFIQESLGRHLAEFGVAITPRRVEFGRKKGRIHRGGLLNYSKLRKDVVNWLNQDADAVVTTMVDLYALPTNFPGRAEGAKIRDPQARVSYLEEEFGKDIGSNRLMPYIQLHEFEAILFTDISRLAHYYPAYERAIRNLVTETAHLTPEEINEGRTTAPSKRILCEVPIYDKVLAGSVLAIELGLPLIRGRCLHFNAWVVKLEQLGQAAD